MEDFDKKTQKIFGIKHPCILNNLDTFHCITGFPVDVTHDIFESGVARCVTELVLNCLVREKVISLKDVNESIGSFPFHRVDANRPQFLSACGTKISMKQTCNETWVFVRLLPLILLDLFTKTELDNALKRKWSILTTFIRLVQIIMADCVRECDIQKLQSLIKTWQTIFCREFPEQRLTPKFHYMVHYPSQIRQHGPLKRYSSIRFEAKHSAMKHHLSTSKNRINVCKSMAVSHQLAASSHSSRHASRDAEMSEDGRQSCFPGDIITVANTSGDRFFAKVSNVETINNELTYHVSELVAAECREHLMAYSVKFGPKKAVGRMVALSAITRLALMSCVERTLCCRILSTNV